MTKIKILKPRSVKQNHCLQLVTAVLLGYSETILIFRVSTRLIERKNNILRS